ncbi:hypothetical protein ACWD4F_30865 [Streptomyces aureus]
MEQIIGFGARLVPCAARRAGARPGRGAVDGRAGLIADPRKEKENEAGSSNDLRADVLRVLGVLKVATADQIQRLSLPHLTYRHTTKPARAKQKEARTASHRAAANDLRRTAWPSTAAARAAVKRSAS